MLVGYFSRRGPAGIPLICCESGSERLHGIYAHGVSCKGMNPFSRDYFLAVSLALLIIYFVLGLGCLLLCRKNEKIAKCTVGMFCIHSPVGWHRGAMMICLIYFR